MHLSLRNDVLITSTSNLQINFAFQKTVLKDINFIVFVLGMHSSVNHSSYHSSLSYLSLSLQIIVPNAPDSLEDGVGVAHAQILYSPQEIKPRTNGNHPLLGVETQKNSKVKLINIFNHIHTHRNIIAIMILLICLYIFIQYKLL